MTMKKKYTVPTINVVMTEDLCDTGLKVGSVYQKEVNPEQKIGQFEIIEQSQTKKDFSNLWGNSNKDKWGDD